MYRMFVLVLVFIPAVLCAQAPISLYKIDTSATSRPILTQPAQVLVPGKLNIVTFSMFFTACPPCVNEINVINKRLKLLHLDDSVAFSVIASVKKELPGIASLFASAALTDNHWAFPVYIDTNFAFSDAWGFRSFPMTILIDRDGKGLYGSDLAKDTVIELRTKKLFDKISEKLHPSPASPTGGNGPKTMHDMEQPAYNSPDFFERGIKRNVFPKITGVNKNQPTVGQLVLFEVCDMALSYPA